MISRYGIFCTVVDSGNFTKAAEILGYTQSAVSQSVKALEDEIGTVLLNRKRGELTLTADGRQYYPFIRSIYASEQSLEEKKLEMEGLDNLEIKIGTFTNISRDILPRILHVFQHSYPSVRFTLRQGDYSSIPEWLSSGEIDLGFINANAVDRNNIHPLYRDRMMAVIPPAHPLAKKEVIRGRDIENEQFILMDEGEYNEAKLYFKKTNCSPNILYTVSDDYTIMSMVRQNLGISFLYERTVSGFEDGLIVRPIYEGPVNEVSLMWRDYSTMPKAARIFMDFIIDWFNTH